MLNKVVCLAVFLSVLMPLACNQSKPMEQSTEPPKILVRQCIVQYSVEVWVKTYSNKSWTYLATVETHRDGVYLTVPVGTNYWQTRGQDACCGWYTGNFAEPLENGDVETISVGCY